MLRHEEATCIKPCSCGFDDKKLLFKPNDRQPTSEFCPNTNKLDNHVDCPSFDALCDEENPCEPYWRFIRGSIKQVRHWCFMGEIEEAGWFPRLHLSVRTRFNEKVKVTFDLEESSTPRTFSFNDASSGHTILIVDAEKCSSFGMSTSIRQEEGDLVVIFKCSMKTLIKTFGSMMDSPACFQCGATNQSTTQDVSLEKQENSPDSSQLPSANLPLKQCSKCRVALYCGKLCQTQHWGDSHKKLCSSMKYLELLRKLDFATTSIISPKNCRPFLSLFSSFEKGRLLHYDLNNQSNE